ncbi:hypothetical protein [Crocosphaera sp. Alani8]|uniref:hypothetical protein n=1 Tax=Crocosphaera sp. Alani8 TaxID=3038952 RepID=UPI00313E4579
MKKVSKQIKPKSTDITDSNDNSNPEDELLFRQTNNLKRYSSTYDEIREEICSDSFQDFNDEYGWDKLSDLVYEQDDLTEDYVDSLVMFD